MIASRTHLPSLGWIALLAVVVLSLHASCARSVASDPETAPQLLDPDAGKASTQLACVETRCPAPWATCPGNDGLCTTDLKSDVAHCGACDAACPSAPPNARSLCSGGQCRIACNALYADCNGLAADGCEVALESDPANCGGCKLACAPGVLCWLGACGCPNGFTRCGNECRKLDSDSMNCGACENVCGPPLSAADPAWKCGPFVSPPNTAWPCVSSACTLSCKPGFGDCNNQFCADGCEIDLSSDRENCGVCGRACAANQQCVDGACLCPPGTTRCGSECVDLATDPSHCGACSNDCPGPTSRNPRRPGGGSPACIAGQCSYVCYPGFADCDGDIDTGCEVNLRNDPAHCGSCTTKCNVAAGQPCVAGACLTKTCDDAGPVR